MHGSIEWLQVLSLFGYYSGNNQYNRNKKKFTDDTAFIY